MKTKNFSLLLLVGMVGVFCIGTAVHAEENQSAFKSQCESALKAQRDSSQGKITWPDQEIARACAGVNPPAGVVQWPNVKTCLAMTGAPTYIYDIHLKPCVADHEYYKKMPCYKEAKGKNQRQWTEEDIVRGCVINNMDPKFDRWDITIDCMAAISPGEFSSAVLGGCKKRPIFIMSCLGVLKENRASNTAILWPDKQITDACALVAIQAGDVQWPKVQACLKETAPTGNFFYGIVLTRCIDAQKGSGAGSAEKK